MKIGMVVNRIETEKDDYTTIRLARIACERGHDVAFIGLGDFIYDPCGSVHAHTISPRSKDYADDAALLADIQGKDAVTARLSLEDLDVLMLRSDPADEMSHRPWAPTSGLLFAQLAAARGVIVLSDPVHLTDAQNKTYFQHFPEQVRPETCITRNHKVITEFVEAHADTAVIKPLQGSGGRGVFIIRPEDKPNINQMIDAVVRDGYALVQEYLPKAEQGDLRLLLINGRPLEVDGTYACVKRHNETKDMRNNISAGAKTTAAQPDEDALRLAEIVGPKLINDGMYLVGLDIVGDKLMEINVDTPGGLNMIEDLTGVDFCGHILDDLEHKVRMKAYYGQALDNRMLAVI